MTINRKINRIPASKYYTIQSRNHVHTGNETHKKRHIKIRVVGMAPCQDIVLTIQWFYKNKKHSFQQTIVLTNFLTLDFYVCAVLSDLKLQR